MQVQKLSPPYSFLRLNQAVVYCQIAVNVGPLCFAKGSRQCHIDYCVPK